MVKYINIYAQQYHHDDVEIYATKESLLQLRHIIDHLLNEDDLNCVFCDFMDSCGEGYDLYLHLVPEEDFVKLQDPLKL